jgi:hypothetical protein
MPKPDGTLRYCTVQKRNVMILAEELYGLLQPCSESMPVKGACEQYNCLYHNVMAMACTALCTVSGINSPERAKHFAMTTRGAIDYCISYQEQEERRKREEAEASRRRAKEEAEPAQRRDEGERRKREEADAAGRRSEHSRPQGTQPDQPQQRTTKHSSLKIMARLIIAPTLGFFLAAFADGIRGGVTGHPAQFGSPVSYVLIIAFSIAIWLVLSKKGPFKEADEKVPCRECGKILLKRMAALNDGYCTGCTKKSVVARGTLLPNAETTNKTTIDPSAPVSNTERTDALASMDVGTHEFERGSCVQCGRLESGVRMYGGACVPRREMPSRRADSPPVSSGTQTATAQQPTGRSDSKEVKWSDFLQVGDRVQNCGSSTVDMEHKGTVLEVREDEYCVVRWDAGGVRTKIMGGPSFVDLVHAGDLYRLSRR